MVKNCVLGGLLCVVASGCGANLNTVNSLAPSAVAAPASLSGGGQFAVQSIGSCPDGNAPGWLTPWVKGTTVRLRWSEVAPNIEYHVIVQRYDVTNKYIPVENGNFFTNGTWSELTLSPGRYEGMIQTRSCGKSMGPWSQSLQFSVDDDDSTSGEAPLQSGESSEGQRVFPGQSLTDSTGAIWTLGAEGQPGTYQVLRNGVIDQGTFASQLKYHNHTVYLFAHDGNWYQYLGGGNWASVGPGEP